MPIPPPAGIAGAGSLVFATTDSVVNNVDATLVAFWSALLVTLAGSRIPAFTMSTYSSLYASKPIPGSASFTLLIITDPSKPALAAIWNNGADNAFNTTFTPVFSSPSNVSANSATTFEA